MARRFAFGDDCDIARKFELAAKLRAISSFYAMAGPSTALLKEGNVVYRMPIPGSDDGQPPRGELRDLVIERADDAIGVLKREPTAGQEVVLHINN
jgi:hypothetical protein